MKKLKGTAMKELVEGGELMIADILLTRSKRSLLGWLIRLGTGSDWDHALMVYPIKATHLGYGTTFIIESTWDRVHRTVGPETVYNAARITLAARTSGSSERSEITVVFPGSLLITAR